MAWYDNLLVNSFVAIILGGLAVALPQLDFMAMFPVASITLFQTGLIVFAGAFIGLAVVGKSQTGLIPIIGGFALIVSGFLIGTSIGGDVKQDTSIDYVFDSDFNGTFSGTMTESNSLLSVNSGSTGTFQSNIIYTNASTDFNRVNVEVESQLQTDDKGEVRVRTYDSGSLAGVHTYNITKERTGIQDFNVSKINSLSEVDSFDYRLTLEDNSGPSPEIDSFAFETTQTVTESTAESGILEAITIFVYVMGGIMVAVAGLT